MKTNKNRTAKAADAPNKPNLGARVRKFTNRSRGHHPIPAGEENENLLVQEKNSSFYRSPEGVSPKPIDQPFHFSEMNEKLPMAERNLGKDLHPSAKIKLQLFPVDDHTRIGLEKDGYHPYLELTLSSRKRVSSVLKHLNGKWGGSSIAVGNPILFPYSISEDLASQQWTLNDTDASAGDVYTAIGSPSVFRLRYGWVSESETKSSDVPSTSAPPLDACLQPKGTEKGCSANVESAFGEGKNIEAATEEYCPSIARGSPDVVGEDKMPCGRLFEDMSNEVRPDVGVAQSPAQWDDRMTDISIGGLLSEASLQGRFNNCHSKSTGITGGLQASQLITDSLDAFIAAHIDRSQGPKPPTHGSTSSIFDAEDARHAFPVLKSSAASREARGLSESVHLQTCCQEAGSKTIKDQNAIEVNILSGLPQGFSSQGSQTDTSLCSRVYNDENSLGLSGIKWTESLGPFDLGLSSSRKIISGDSLNISKLFS